MSNWNTYNAAKRRRERKKMFDKQHGKCAHCGGAMTLDPSERTSPMYATFDHVIPYSSGGPAYGNLVLACRACNEWRGTLPVEDFRRIVNR